MRKALDSYFHEINSFHPSEKEKEELNKIVYQINSSIIESRNIVFICTHNSRRSQYCEVWGNVFSILYNEKLTLYSAGTVSTNVYPEVINSFSRAGLETKSNNTIVFNNTPIKLDSKTLDEIGAKKFISLITCSDAEKSCPIDKRSIKNIQFFHRDPKAFDDTPQEIEAYDSICFIIAKQLNYIIKRIN